VQALSNPPPEITAGMPLPTAAGDWWFCCEIWIWVPRNITDAAIWRAARQLQAMALEPESLCSEEAAPRESLCDGRAV
jgi:hypothetical protein